MTEHTTTAPTGRSPQPAACAAVLPSPPVPLDELVPAWLTVPELAEALGIEVTRARQLLRDRQVLAVRRGGNAALHVPTDMVHGGVVVKGLPGTLTVLADAGYDDEAAVRWLFTPDDSLPGTPVQALRDNRGTEVRRRAQALGF